MVVSHEHRYVFVEIPQTASKAIASELRTHYGGESTLLNHSSYPEFFDGASAAARRYFVFATVRNPLDVVVSKYFKAATDHRGQYATEEEWATFVGRNRRVRREYELIAGEKVDFGEYFRRMYRLVYNSRCALLPRPVGYVIRYEQLAEDFSRVLSMLGLEQRRPLPAINTTADKEADFHSYYTPDLRPRAARIFGPYMAHWGYAFPSEWGETAVSPLAGAAFRLDGAMRRFYYTRVHNRLMRSRRRRAGLPAAPGGA